VSHQEAVHRPDQPVVDGGAPGVRIVPGTAVDRVPAPQRRLLARHRQPGLRWPRLPWYLELLVIIAGDVVYEVIRASAPQKAVEAFHNAAMLTAMEPEGVRRFESWLRDLTNTHPALNQVFSWYYSLLHLSVTVGVLVWLWWRRPEQYARARTALFALTFGGLLIFWMFPVAPPRLVTPEAINALGTPAISALDGTGGLSAALGSLVNPYAAFPSLHVAWSAWCAWAVWAHLRGHRARWAAWAYPLATSIVVIGTSNHYVIDVLAGLLVVLLAILI